MKAIVIILGVCLFLPVLLLNINSEWWPALIVAFALGLASQRLLKAWREKTPGTRRRIG